MKSPEAPHSNPAFKIIAPETGVRELQPTPDQIETAANINSFTTSDASIDASTTTITTTTLKIRGLRALTPPPFFE